MLNVNVILMWFWSDLIPDYHWTWMEFHGIPPGTLMGTMGHYIMGIIGFKKYEGFTSRNESTSWCVLYIWRVWRMEFQQLATLPRAVHNKLETKPANIWIRSKLFQIAASDKDRSLSQRCWGTPRPMNMAATTPSKSMEIPISELVLTFDQNLVVMTASVPWQVSSGEKGLVDDCFGGSTAVYIVHELRIIMTLHIQL